MDTQQELELRFDHGVIEHLGVKLYQNKPTNVIAELVSNAWDADAKTVDIQIQTSAVEPYISIADDGFGMTFQTLREVYLLIGKNKRTPDSPEKKSARKPMGRKGLGKLAPFGIAELVDVCTISEDSGELLINWIRIDLAEIKKISNTSGKYKPQIISSQISTAKASDNLGDSDVVHNFIATHKDKAGTLILLRRLTSSRFPSPEGLCASLARRFTVILTRQDFKVKINDTLITKDIALPQFEFRIPEGDGTTSVKLDDRDDREIKYWVGFVESASWAVDQAGVGIFAHGKIAQDRPFFFNIKGKEIFYRYMYAEIEADWIDELSEDVISTDRTSINWDHGELKSLYSWGEKNTKKWLTDYLAYRDKKERQLVDGRLKDKMASQEIPRVTEAERKQLGELIADVRSVIGKDEVAAAKVDSAIAQAWVRKPMRRLVKKLWDKIKLSDDPIQLSEIIEELRIQLVPESLSLAVEFAQKAYALSLMHELVYKGREVDLQKLAERFPWLINSELEMLSADQSLKRMVLEAEELGLLLPDRGRLKVDSSFQDGQDIRPDFVFLSSPGDKKTIAIVEIKNPQKDLTMANRLQLESYMSFIEQRYSEVMLKGFLIGSNSTGIKAQYSNMTVVSWVDTFLTARRQYLNLLSALLVNTNPDANDDRMLDIMEFGGQEAWELLKHFAANDERIAELFSEFKNEQLYASPQRLP